MSNEHSEPGHGDSPAAWTAVVVMLVGIAAGTVGLFLHFTYPGSWDILIWAGVIVLVVGAILGFVLKRMGFGVDGSRSVSKASSH
ncbi:HGxxPAAW family protein [Naasia aerilata]|nr:HGxxPAAW family protein [Naasia aerilata]